MDTQVPESTIVEMARMLEMRGKGGHPTVLFLGGRTGGLFRSQNLYKIIRPFAIRTLNGLSRTEQFGECFKVLREKGFGETELDIIFTASLEGLEVSRADSCLAELIKQKLFDVVISTNIDDLLERALEHVNMRASLDDFYVHIPKRNNPTFAGMQRTFTFVKAFGDKEAHEYRMKEEFYLNGDKDLKEDLQSYLERDILMIGFDPTWDQEIDDIYPLEGKSLWYVDEQLPADSSRIWRALHHRQGSRYIKGVPGTYDSFMQELHNCLIGRGPLSHELVREMFNQLQEIREVAVQIRNDISQLQTWVQELRTTRRES